jgi:LacI family transcriptional regulator
MSKSARQKGVIVNPSQTSVVIGGRSTSLSEKASSAPAVSLPRIAVVLDAYFERMYAGVSAYARTANWDLDVTALRNPGVLPRGQKWAGAIAVSMYDASVDWLKNLDCPVVYALSAERVPANAPFVIYDLEAAGRCGAQHLLELGGVNFGYYRGGLGSESTSIQMGFNREIESHGFMVSHFNFPMPRAEKRGTHSRTTRGDRVEWLIGQLKEAAFPLAVMAEDDRYAVDLTFAARALGLRIPEDIAILGSEEEQIILGTVSTPISSIDVNLYTVGWRCAELTHRLMTGAKAGSEEVPLLTCVPPKGVVVRESTATFVCKNPVVTAAAMFVRRNFRESISSDDVAAAAGISRRGLQEQYGAHVGRTIKEDILFHRLRSAKHLLERTNLKLAAVAFETGFGNDQHFCKVFRRECGMTPHAWRMQHAPAGA